MEMQREDFLALCKGPENGGMFFYNNPLTGPGWAPTHSGLGRDNARRIIMDWFPVGEAFTFLGARCMSRGLAPRAESPNPPMLLVVCAGRDGFLEERTFSVREALSIAKQVSVDTINRLNGVNFRGL